jgi:uncharacterized protein (TIGR03437 family)
MLLAYAAATARAQHATLSNVDFSPCCIAPDGHGNNFIVSSGYQPELGSQPPTISVAKMDFTGNLVSQFAFQPGTYGIAAAAAVDPQGNLWIAGSRLLSGPSDNEPIVGLIAKLDSTGTKLLFSGSFGGKDTNGYTRINAIAFDPAGNLYLGGFTGQSDFPLTPGAFISQVPTPSPPAGCIWDGPPSYGFIAKLTQANQATPPYTLAYSTLLGGQQLPACSGFPPFTNTSALAVDANGIVTAAGTTEASDFPVTQGAFQTQYEGQANDDNLFITRLDAQGAGLVWSTLVGAPATIAFDNMTVSGMALDSNGNAVIAGTTNAPSIPVTAGALQPQFANPQDSMLPNGFVAKLDSTGASLIFSTYYGIDNNLSAPRLDAQGDIWISGSVFEQSGLPLHPHSLDLGGSLIAELAPDGSSVLFSELLSNGVAGQDMVLNRDGSLTLAGPAQAAGLNNLPNGFVLRLPQGPPTGVSVLSVADSAVNAVTSTVAPGEFLSIYGTGLGPAVGAGMKLGPGGKVTNSLGGTQVSFDGIPAPLIYASARQINVLAPYELKAGQQVNMQITTDAGSSQTGPLQVVPLQPSVFAVLNSDGSVNSASHLASQGSLVSIFVSGAGALNPALPDGTIAPSPAPAPALPVQVIFNYSLPSFLVPIIGSQIVTPTYAGGIPGTVIDLLRVDAKVPAGLTGAWGFTVTVHVGSSSSSPIPLYVVLE